MLYELLTGERPYKLRRDTRGALEEAILQADPAAQKAGEDVGDLLQQAIRGHPKFYIEGALRGIDHRPTGWQPSASVSPDLIRQPCSPRPATP